MRSPGILHGQGSKSLSRNNGFARVLKSWDVLVLSFGAMIGWGWVLMSGHWVGCIRLVES